jgi:hypothetical protein
MKKRLYFLSGIQSIRGVENLSLVFRDQVKNSTYSPNTFLDLKINQIIRLIEILKIEGFEF